MKYIIFLLDFYNNYGSSSRKGKEKVDCKLF